MNQDNPGDDPKLYGWKEIAAYFDRTTRTVQRWEREFRLPVHRMGLAKAEVVYALLSELEAWQKATEPEKRHRPSSGEATGASSAEQPLKPDIGELEDALPPHDTQPNLRAVSTWSRRAWLVGLVLLFASAAAFLLSLVRFGDAAPTNPMTRAVVEASTLRVFASDGREAWNHRFEHPVMEQLYANPAWSIPRPLEFMDVDGDGSRELVALALFSDGKHGAPLYCFNADGSRRFSWLVSRSVRFGGQVFAPPFRASLTLLTGGNGRPAIWAAAVHHLYFPSVVSRLDANGRAETEFWTNGSVTRLASGEFLGRRVVLIGAANNELKSASLVVIDAGNASGSTPAENPGYRCDDCPPGTTLASIVFPVLDLAVEAGAGGIPCVDHILLDDAGVNVRVRYPLPSDEGLSSSLVPAAWYTLDRELRPIHAELSSSYPAAHRRAQRAGLVQREFNAEKEERRLFPIKSWNGKKYVEVWPTAK